MRNADRLYQGKARISKFVSCSWGRFLNRMERQHPFDCVHRLDRYEDKVAAARGVPCRAKSTRKKVTPRFAEKHDGVPF